MKTDMKCGIRSPFVNATPKASRRQFLATCQTLALGSVVSGASGSAFAARDSKTWKVAIHMDTSIPTLGFHGLHAAFHGLPGVEIVGLFDRNHDKIEQRMARTKARRHYTDYREMLDKESPDIVVLTSRLPNL